MLVKSLVETKARIGVFAIALGAYLPQFPTLVPEFDAQYKAFKEENLPDTVEIIDVEDVPLQYYPGNTCRVKVKAAGDLA